MARTTTKKTETSSKEKTEISSKEKSLEERLARLEALGENIRRTDIPLDDALRDFEEGIKLARYLEKELEKIQNRIEVLMNGADAKPSDSPVLDLFDNE